MRKSFVALLLILGMAALSANAFAQLVGDTGGERIPSRIGQMHSRAASLGVSAVANDTVWVGYSSALSPGQLANNYWSVGAVGGAVGTLSGPVQPGTPAGKPRPSQPIAGAQTGYNGVWTWEYPVHGDSLQGWWPVRNYQLRAGGLAALYTQDFNRPWWAGQFGNLANYVMNERRDGSGTSPGDRTFGVVGVWHSDPGNVVTDSIPGTNVHAPAWTPIEGLKSAWMGQRGHGDKTVQDPITKNYFNADITDFLGPDQSNGAFANESSKHFPGYGTAQDQMLYRDVAVDNNASNGVTLTFRYRSRMSFGKGTGTTTRTGWFDGDPLQATVGSTAVAAGNFISAEAGTPANSKAPVDSFQVYVGEPIGDGSSADAAASWTDSNGDLHTSVYDYARRWFNEVLARGNRLWLFGNAGNAATANPDTTITLVLSGADKVALQGATGRLRFVFRVHTNMGFDDENTLFSVASSYNSGYMGAVQLDDVTIDLGSGASQIGDFEGSTASKDIDNAGGVTAENAWKSTGKPPAIYFHVHDLTDLSTRWFDLCGGPTSPTNICNTFGQVISMGNHDDNENNSGPSGTTEQNHYHGMFSPTINLVGNGTGTLTVNAMNLTTDMAAGSEDYYNKYEIYTGIFDLFTTGALWQFGFEWYPVRQADGGVTWSGLRRPPFRYFQPDPTCSNNYDGAKINSALTTSNVSGVPDSARIFQQKLSECFRFGIPDADCGGGLGLGLFDNLALVIIDGVPQAISNDIWQWFVDTFPVNETSSLVGTADFDTCAAQIRSSLNTAAITGTSTRYDTAADSVVVNADGFGNNIRLDMVFRIKPGPGNYFTAGNVATGLRRIPTSPIRYVAGDNSFWDVYTTYPGDKSAGTHPPAPGWNILTWNSARCDTTQAYNVFADLAVGIDKTSGGASKTWTATYHEAEIASRPKLAVYAALNKRLLCFVKDTTQSTLNQNNVLCGETPEWIRLKPASATGFAGDSLTTEGISILPDGLFVPGTHVEYFFRREDLTGPTPGKVDLSPDTSVVYPQAQESSFDGHRWQEFSVLPDKWKDPAYGGAQKACMLYIDWNDRRGDEIIWTSIADSIGATSAGARGQNNGWAAPGGAGLNGEVNNPAYFVNRNASAGTSWDKYDVKCAESLNNGHNSIGARLSNRTHAGGDLTIGKDEMNAPTPDMLKGYYKVLLLLSGDLTTVLGPFTDRSANDVGILEDFLLSSTKTAHKGLLCGGLGFVEDASLVGGVQQTFINNYLGVDLNATSAEIGYRTFSGNPAAMADILPQNTDLGSPTLQYGLRNVCFVTMDVLRVVNGLTTPNAAEGARYTDFGANGPYIAAVENKGDDAHPWYTLTEGWDIFFLTSRFDVSTYGRLQYYYTAFANVFGSICAVQGTALVPLDTPNTGNGQQYVDFVGNFSNNPLRSGSAVVRFGLAHADRVEVDVYDVAGRLQRKLADRMFPAGEHTLTWDGVNDQGHLVPRGVYFTQVKYVNRHISNSKKLTVLK